MNNKIENIKKMYPRGTKIMCIHMDDIHAIPYGMMGVVEHVDDAGTIHMHWENGSGLGLVPGVDTFKVVGGSENV